MNHLRGHVRAGVLDPELVEATRAAIAAIEAHPGEHVRVPLNPELAALFKEFATVLLEAGGVAFGPLGAELSPEAAGTILGVSRPLVVQRMDDGRLPFRYVGSHRRCLLTDVLSLKAAEASQNEAMGDLYHDLMDIDDAPPP